MKYGLLGEKLGHSISPEIHEIYGNSDYQLLEVPENQVKNFILAKKYQGLNITIPYKEKVLPFCDQLSARAKKIGSINTLILQADNSLYGDNTDYLGFLHLAAVANLNFRGKKVVIMGDGGTGKMAKVAIADSGARDIVQLSRHTAVNYGAKKAYLDGEILVNTTPVGMYPHNGQSLVDLSEFPNLEGVLDVIYNPLRTELLLQAEALGIPCAGGLPMLTEQARQAAMLFFNKKITPEMGERACRKIRQRLCNIVVVGNESAALALGQELKRPVVTGGDWEDIAREKSLILSVTKDAAKNHYKALRQNGVLFPANILKWGNAGKVEDILRSL